MAHELVLTETFVSALERYEKQDAERILNNLEGIGEFPDHFLDRLKHHPGYKLSVGDYRMVTDWDTDTEVISGIDAFERTKEYRNLGKYREVWGSRCDDQHDE